MRMTLINLFSLFMVVKFLKYLRFFLCCRFLLFFCSFRLRLKWRKNQLFMSGGLSLHLPCWHEYIKVVHPFAKRFLRSGSFFGLKFLSVRSIWCCSFFARSLSVSYLAGYSGCVCYLVREPLHTRAASMLRNNYFSLWNLINGIEVYQQFLEWYESPILATMNRCHSLHFFLLLSACFVFLIFVPRLYFFFCFFRSV